MRFLSLFCMLVLAGCGRSAGPNEQVRHGRYIAAAKYIPCRLPLPYCEGRIVSMVLHDGIVLDDAFYARALGVGTA